MLFTLSTVILCFCKAELCVYIEDKLIFQVLALYKIENMEREPYFSYTICARHNPI